MPDNQNTRRPQTRPFVKVVGMVLLLALIASAVLAVGPSLTASATPPASAPAAAGTAMPAPRTEPSPSSPAGPGTPEFTSCLDVWAGGQGPFLAGEPGYSAALDPDGDGIACPSRPK